mgnify:CR=1 FL=1
MGEKARERIHTDMDITIRRGSVAGGEVYEVTRC